MGAALKEIDLELNTHVLDEKLTDKPKNNNTDSTSKILAFDNLIKFSEKIVIREAGNEIPINEPGDVYLIDNKKYVIKAEGEVNLYGGTNNQVTAFSKTNIYNASGLELDVRAETLVKDCRDVKLTAYSPIEVHDTSNLKIEAYSNAILSNIKVKLEGLFKQNVELHSSYADNFYLTFAKNLDVIVGSLVVGWYSTGSINGINIPWVDAIFNSPKKINGNEPDYTAKILSCDGKFALNYENSTENHFLDRSLHFVEASKRFGNISF